MQSNFNAFIAALGTQLGVGDLRSWYAAAATYVAKKFGPYDKGGPTSTNGRQMRQGLPDAESVHTEEALKAWLGSI
jgi:hypothetical protein